MQTMTHRFVDPIPDKLEANTLYVSMRYCIAVHNCACGCGNEVATPISPIGWEVSFNGESVSLYPSIGSWNLSCRSHYWIRNGRVEWGKQWNQETVQRARMRELAERQDFFVGKRRADDPKAIRERSIIDKIRHWFLTRRP
jgi:hypothetical protein